MDMWFKRFFAGAAMTKSMRILDVGQCNVDGPRLGRFLSREFHCTVDRAQTKEEAVLMVTANHYDLVLINRELSFDRSSGLAVIPELRKIRHDLRIMLVSDMRDAQEEAVKLGAIRGFGKSNLDSEATEELLRGVLSSS
jgi:ActR/RegA family two-component response regulator